MNVHIDPALLKRLQGFRRPIVDPKTPTKETGMTSFGDLVRMLPEGIASAQASLDRTSAERVAELANTRVWKVPSITEQIAEDGTVTYIQGEPREVSLLELGLRPTFYRFSEATVDVAMDVKIMENESESGSGERRMAMYADTASVRFERKLNRDVSASSRLKATLVPVPMPLRLGPTMSTEPAEEE